MKTNLPSQQALDKKAENARELGLDYDPSTGTQVSKVWWDGDRLMAQPIPPENLYKEPEQPAQQEPVARCMEHGECFGGECIYTSPPASKPWVGLTDEERVDIAYEYESSIAAALMVEAKLREKNAAPCKPLTDEQIWKNDAIMSANSGYGATFDTLRDMVRAIEAAHNIKE